MTSHRLSGLDIAFLSMDGASAPLNNSALLVFEQTTPTQPEAVVDLLAGRVAQVPRLRRRVRYSRLRPGTAHWVDDPYFQPRAHIRFVRTAPHGTRAELAEYVAEATVRPLDRSRPLWEIHVINGLPDGTFAILLKVHHALADGVGLYVLTAALFDGLGTPAGQTEQDPPEPPSPLGELWERLARPHRWPGAFAERAKARLTALAGLSQDAGIAASILLNTRLWTKTPLSGHPVRTPARRQLTTVQLDAATIRRIREKHRVSTNDVVLAILAGGLRAGLPGMEDASVRALVPVNLRGQGLSSGNSNEISGYLCDLPVSDPEPLRRLRAVHQVMKRNKAGGPYKGAGALPFLANRIPGLASQVAALLVSGQAGLLFDLVVTYVALPEVALRMGGARLREIYPSVPLGKGQALSIGVARYRDSINFAVVSDPAILPDAEKLASTLPAAVEELVMATERANGSSA